MKRGLAVGAVVLLIGVSAGLGWWFGRGIRSPAQIAAEAEPPDPSLITVEVERKELSANVITRADVGYDAPAILSLGGALGGRPDVLVVTAAPARGEDLAEGSAAIEIAGRPVFLLVGAIPVFRDMRPGTQGPDILQVEQALARLGFFTGAPDQKWDDDTGEAVRAWYQENGYQANGVSEQERTELRTARTRVSTATDGLTAARKALQEARNPSATAVRGARAAVTDAQQALDKLLNPPASNVRQAQSAVTDAQQALDKLLNPPASNVRQAQSAVTAATENLQATQTKIADDAAAAEEAVTTAQRARERAAQAYAQAEQNWRSAQMGVHPGSGAIPAPAELNALRLAVDGARIELNAAEKAITDAQESLDQRPAAAATELRTARNRLLDAQKTLDELTNPPESAQRTARNRLLDAQKTLDELTNPPESAQRTARNRLLDAQEALAGLMNPPESARRTARNRLLDAQEALAGLLAPPDIADKERHVQEAETALADAAKALADLEAETGTWLPAGEIIFLRRMPVRVDALTAEQGTVVTGGFMTVTGSDLAVRGSVPVRDISLVKQGAAARIEDPALTDPIPGTIRLLEDRPGTRGVSSDRHYMEIVADGEMPDELIGANVRVVIPVGGTEGEVWAVPAAALSATADGTTRIEIARPDGTARFVEVEPGLAAQGLVEVTPLDGEISAGDQVVVGVASLE